MKRRHVAGLLPALMAPGQPLRAATPFEQAMHDYDQQRFGSAFAAFGALADAGHAEAARIALLMSVHDRRLYGIALPLDGARRQRWLDAAAATGRGAERATARRD